jgi:hypothetical protein
VMTGVAMAGRYLGQNIVTLTWIGDGGSSTGAFHEGLGLAAAQRAPFVLIVENNQWAYSTPVSRQVPIKNLADRAVAYGITSAIVDGNDIVAVYTAAKEAVDECRAGRGPRLIEVKTMRMRGHAQHDPAEYVPKQMFEYWRARDPIALYEKYLTENKIWDAAAKSEIDARIERELDVEQKFAEDSPLPPPALAEEGVYCDGCHKIEADWKRSKADLMPPKSSIHPAWRLEDLGGLSEISATPHAVPPGNGAKTPASDTPKVAATAEPGNTAARPLAAAPGEIVEEPAVLRVPFGRGPKDKAFLQSPENPQNKTYRRGALDKSFHKGGQDKLFNKNAAGKSFGKNPNGKPFGKNQPGKAFSKNVPDKQGKR